MQEKYAHCLTIFMSLKNSQQQLRVHCLLYSLKARRILLLLPLNKKIAVIAANMISMIEMIDTIDTIDTLNIIEKTDHDTHHLLRKTHDIKIKRTLIRVPTITRNDTAVIKVISPMNQTVMIDKITNNNNSSSNKLVLRISLAN